MKKLNLQGPGWFQVIFGALLSVILGVALGAGLLVLRPVVVAKQEPKEREKGAVYFVDGTRDSGRGRQAMAKRQAFLAGESITVNEDEINTLLAAAIKAGAAPAAPATPATKGSPAAPAAPADSAYLSAGAPSVRIREGSLQLGVPLGTSLLAQKIIFQAHGGFVRRDDTFVFEPKSMYLGSCPLERLPYVAGYVRERILAEYPLPADLKAAWAKLTNVVVEGNTLKLTMP